MSTTKFGRIFVEHRSIHDLGSSGKKPDPNSARERVVFFIEPTGEKSILDWLQFRKHDALPPEKVAFDIYPIQWSDDWKLMPSQGESAHPFTALEMRALQQAIRAYFFQEFRRSVRFQ